MLSRSPFRLFYSLPKASHQLLQTPKSSPWLDFIGIVFLSVLLRWVFLWLTNPPLQRISDQVAYLAMARDMALGQSHERYGNYFLPAWPFVLSFLFRIVDNLFAARLLACFIGGINSGLVYLIGTKCFDRKTGLIAGSLHAFFPELICFHHTLFAETLTETFMLGGTAALFWRKEPRRFRSWAVASLMFGFGLLCKHLALLGFAGLVMVAIRRASFPWRRLAYLVFLFSLPSVLFLSWLAIQGRDGLMLFSAPLSNARTWFSAGKGGRVIAPHDRPDELWKYQEQLSELRPVRFAHLTWLSFSSLWSPGPFFFMRRMVTGRYPVPRAVARAAVIYEQIWFLLLLSAGFAGLCFSSPAPFRSYAIAVLLLLSVSCAFFFAFTRYRIPFLSLIVLFASRAFTLDRAGFSTARRRQWIAYGAIMAVAILVAVENIGTFLTVFE